MKSRHEEFSVRSTLLSVAVLLVSSGVALAQTTSFTYQGRLTDGGNAANGSYDLQFALFDSSSGGTQIVSTLTRSSVAVSGGVFSVLLDFGVNAFPGADRFLEISARLSGSGSFTLLSPRQQITSTPYAIRSANATTADTATGATTATNATQLGGVAASQYVLTTDSRMSDARNPLPNSANYVQNTTNPQPSSNFNITGDGTAGGMLTGNAVNATTQYNIGGNRVLSIPGTHNLFAGTGAGQANTLGTDNSFFGYNAGLNNTGNLTVGGRFNSFYGSGAGQSNTQGRFNSFFGVNAGSSNVLGANNSFFGGATGTGNTGNDNSFFGTSAGLRNTTGERNSFFGSNAGSSNLSGSDNTVIGANANVGANNLTAATAIGANATVNLSDSIVLGNNANVGIGLSNPSAGRLQVSAGADANGLGTAIYAITFFNNGIGVYGAVGLATNNSLAARFDGRVYILNLDTAGVTPICRNSVNVISVCSSSLRYKKDVARFAGGLDIVNRLRPIAFTWKQGGTRDVGLAAEDVEKVEPLLTFRNDKGEIEGVKYNQLSAVFVNAIKEQQTQIETLRTANAALNARLRSVERIVRKRGSAPRRRR
jgi:hypothetical protein